MFTAAAELILFAAKSIIKLSGQVKKAFIDNIKKKELVLPLPSFPIIIDWTTARSFFENTGSKFASKNPRINTLLQKSLSNLLTPEEEDEFCFLHRECKGIQMANNGSFLENGISGEDYEALVTIVQWERGDNPNPSPLQRIGGTLVEIAVDYFSENEKVLNKNSKEHKALKSFLVAIDDVNFAETTIQKLAPELFVAAIESINECPELISSGEKGQELIKGITKGLSENLSNRIDNIDNDLEQEETIKSWGLLVFKSALNSAGETILAEPNKFLNIDNEDQAAFVSNVGSVILDIILSNDIINSPKSSEIFSKESIDAILKASFKTIGEHPNLISIDNDGIKNILIATAKELAAIQDPIGLELLPEISRIVLEKTAGNLEAIWPGDTTNATNHLLIIASKGLLEAISKPTSGGWKPTLSKIQIIDITESVLDEVAENPEWVLTKLDGIPILQKTVEAVFEAIETIPENKLSKNSIKEIIKITIKNMALRQDFINEIPGNNGVNKLIITEVLEIVFAVTLNENVDIKIKWVFVKEQVLTQLIDAVQKKLATRGITLETIDKIKGVLTSEIQNLTNGGEFSIKTLIKKIKTLQLN